MLPDDPRAAAGGPGHEVWARFSRNVAYGLAGKAAQWGASFFLLAYVIRRLGAERFALIVTATSIVAFIQLVQLGASSGFAKQLTAAHARDSRALLGRYFTAASVLSWLLGLLVAAGVLVALAVPRDRWNVPPSLAAESRRVLGAIGAAAVCSCLRLPADGALQAAHRIDLTEKANLLGLSVRAAGVLATFSAGRGTAALYAGILALEAAAALVFSRVAARVVVPAARADLRSTPRHVYGEVLRFNLLTFLDSLDYVLFMQGPVLVLQRQAGLLPAGQYGIGLQLNNLIRGFSVAVATALSPVALSLEARGLRAELRSVYLVATRAFVAAALFLWVNALFLGAPFLALWLRRDATPLVEALPWLLGASALGVAALPAALYLVALRRVRLPATAGLLLACATVATCALSLGTATRPLVRTAASLLACFGAYQLLRMVQVARHLEIRLPALASALAPSLLPALASAGALWALHAWAPPIASWGGLVVAAAASTAVAAIPARGLVLGLRPRRGRGMEGSRAT